MVGTVGKVRGLPSSRPGELGSSCQFQDYSSKANTPFWWSGHWVPMVGVSSQKKNYHTNPMEEQLQCVSILVDRRMWLIPLVYYFKIKKIPLITPSLEPKISLNI